MFELSLFRGATSPAAEAGSARVLITVKAAPNPSALYGETVCVAGLRVHDDGSTSWIRLYPINFRVLEQDNAFDKYDIVRVRVAPVEGRGGDSRIERHRPEMATLRRESHLDPWEPRQRWLGQMVTGDACRLARDAMTDPTAASLALVRPVEVLDLEIERHPGWNVDERAKIDRYVTQLTLFGDENRTPLDAPRFKGWHRYRCHAVGCRTHRQQILDWEFVALQRRHTNDEDGATTDALRSRFLDMMCAADRDPCFYLGNQAKRRQTFSALGCFYPGKSRQGSTSEVAAWSSDRAFGGRGDRDQGTRTLSRAPVGVAGRVDSSRVESTCSPSVACGWLRSWPPTPDAPLAAWAPGGIGQPACPWATLNGESVRRDGGADESRRGGGSVFGGRGACGWLLRVVDTAIRFPLPGHQGATNTSCLAAGHPNPQPARSDVPVLALGSGNSGAAAGGLPGVWFGDFDDDGGSGCAGRRSQSGLPAAAQLLGSGGGEGGGEHPRRSLGVPDAGAAVAG